MNMRAVMVGGAAVCLGALLAGGGWYFWPAPVERESAVTGTDELPIPPVPPRIADSPDYERCLTMLTTDPAGAGNFAAAWQATDGGDPATQCLALSTIAQGEPAQGAAMLDALAAASHAPAVTRAVIYGQAAQAWLMAGERQHAFDASRLAIALSSDDADLLVEAAIAASEVHRYADAIDDLTHALGIDAKRVDALTYRASAWRHLGRLDRAEADIEQAVAIDADDPEALLERGILRQRRDDRTGARSDWERAITLAPDAPAADLARQNLALLEAGPARQ